MSHRKRTHKTHSTNKRKQNKNSRTHSSVVIIGLSASFLRFLIEPEPLAPLASCSADEGDAGSCAALAGGASSAVDAPFIVDVVGVGDGVGGVLVLEMPSAGLRGVAAGVDEALRVEVTASVRDDDAQRQMRWDRLQWRRQSRGRQRRDGRYSKTGKGRNGEIGRAHV